MRRNGYPTYGKQFVGNTAKKEVHNLDNEQKGANECQIDEIIRAGHARTFDPDTLDKTTRPGCAKCPLREQPLVPGVGEGRVMLVGDGPGKTDAKDGKVFSPETETAEPT